MAGKSKDLISKTVYSLIQSMKTAFLMQGAVCKYEPSCSRYAEEAIRTLPFFTAVLKILWRTLRCNPFSRGGFDPVSLTDNQVKGA